MIHGIYFRRIPCSRGPTIFPFFRSNQRSGVLATFDLRLSRSFSHTGSLLPARLSVILRTRLSAHSFTSPFFPPISSRRLEMFPSLSPACFPLPFFRLRGAFLFNRYYAIPALDRGNREIQSDPTIRKIFLLVAFGTSATPNRSPLPPTHSFPSAILYTHLYVEDSKGQRDDASENSMILRHVRESRNEGNHSRGDR